ncbi:MAG: hypothetical protein ACI9Y1_001206 [Lentisphaeria bacterium]|jgi:hypothetical protein
MNDVSDHPKDYYGHRLAEVNAFNPVIANENICNQKGVLLISKGTRFSRSQADLIVNHRLIKPLEHSVDIEHSLAAKGLFDLLRKTFTQLPGLNAVINNESVQSAIKRFCRFYEKHPLLRQKLTVLSQQLPEIYYQSLFSSMAGVALAQELSLGEEDQRTVFIGGLMHNSGFLHLNPELTRNEGELEKNASLDAQVHPIIAKLFLEHVPGLPKCISNAVADHHERTDGTGYPKSKFGDELSIASQIIALTDTIVASYNRCLCYGEHAHQLVLLVLQLNNNVHFATVYKAASRLILRGPMPNTPPANPPTARDVLKQQQRIVVNFDMYKKLAFVLMKNVRSKHTRSIASMVGRLAASFISAGIIQQNYCDWLEAVSKSDRPEDHLSLLKSKILQDEVERQLIQLRVIIWKTIKTIPKEDQTLIEATTQAYNQL